MHLDETFFQCINDYKSDDECNEIREYAVRNACTTNEESPANNFFETNYGILVNFEDGFSVLCDLTVAYLFFHKAFSLRIFYETL